MATEPTHSPLQAIATARFGAALLVASVLASAFAVGVHASIAWITNALFGDPHVVIAFAALPAAVGLVAPAVGAGLGALVTTLTSHLPKSHGVGDVMEAVVLGRGNISIRAALAKAASSFLAIAGGGSVGSEGPLIQFGAAVGGAAGRVAKLDPLATRTLYAAGTAAGFAAAYNTPIAATLFVVEVVAGVSAIELVVPVAFAAAIATAVSRHVFGNAPIYALRTYELVTSWQAIGSALLGPLGGVIGVSFMWLLAGSEKLFARLAIHRVLKASLGGLIVGAIAIALPQVTGNGADTIREMLDGRVYGFAFFALLLAKPAATSASVSSGSAGGVFTPSMFLGAAMGGGLASLSLDGAGADHHPLVGAFALVGMASTVAATTHAPLMAAALAFEMSGDYALVVPLLLATSLATATSKALRAESVYASELWRKGVEWDRSLAASLSGRTY
jgi:CIC family chloride channel protein